jgi:SAM-dependent methyltransferase
VTIPLLNLGRLYPSDFLAPDEEPRSEPFPLELVMDDDGVVHLAEQPPPELLWGERYWYRSDTNASMLRALGDVVASVGQWRGHDVGDPGDVWVDIASNDGTLLSQVMGYTRVGVDPAGGPFAAEARKRADDVITAPFSWAAWQDSPFGSRQAKVVTCVAMFYDLMDPTEFLADVAKLLAPDGLFVLQMSYTPLMLEQLAFDNICHEHARYYTMRSLRATLQGAGFRVIDATLNDVNGGSFRVVAVRQDADETAFGSAPMRDVGRFRVNALAWAEEGTYDKKKVWEFFARRLFMLKCEVRNFVHDAHRQGKTVWGYGASTKGNTLLQYFGLDNTLIDAITDAQPSKWGRRTVGTNIPIVSDEEMRKANPDYLLVLPWHFIDGFRKREADYLASGGKFIVPCPRFEIIGA